jgi:hypothetical protein
MAMLPVSVLLAALFFGGAQALAQRFVGVFAAAALA